MMRKLVSKRAVDTVLPIENADAIEKIMVGGWQVVAKKGEFQPGDECLYFEIDSLLPLSDPRFQFLARGGSVKNAAGKEYFRLRTIKLRGTLSQGLALPLSSFPEIVVEPSADIDFAKTLGVEKFDPPLPGGDQAGVFPTWFVPKTDAERVQNLKAEWDSFQNVEWVASEKIDGTSCTVVWDVAEEKLLVCGRNWEIAEGDNLYWGMVKRYKLDAIVQKLAENATTSAVLQLEIFGNKIQGNPLGVPNQRVAVFNAWVDRNSVWGDPSMMSTLLDNDLVAPILDIPLPATVEDAVSLVDGMKSLVNPDRLAEGIVWQAGGFEPVKAINNKFLLKHNL